MKEEDLVQTYKPLHFMLVARRKEALWPVYTLDTPLLRLEWNHLREYCEY